MPKQLREMSPDRRLSLGLAEVARERDRPLKKRWLVFWGCCWLLFFRVCGSAIAAQQRLWAALGVIALSGPESSLIVPVLISSWFLGLVFLTTRRMRNRPSSGRWFEGMILFSLAVATSHAAVTVGVVLEVYRQVGRERNCGTGGETPETNLTPGSKMVCPLCGRLEFGLVGNVAPVVGAATLAEGHRRLGALVVLHYYTSILELCDTFFLIARKKTSTSLVLHVLFRLQHVWNW